MAENHRFRLKKKVDLRYRRGGTSAYCSQCNYFIRDMLIKGIGGVDLGRKNRCRVIGLDSSRRYDINAQSICDRYDHGIHMLHLIGDTWYRENYGEEKLREALKATRDQEEFLKQLKEEGKV